jgi:hypothetical protein
MKPIGNVDVRSVFILFSSRWVLTILAEKAKRGNKKTKMRVVCVDSVFVFRANLTCRPFAFRVVCARLISVMPGGRGPNFGNGKRNRNGLGFILRSEFSAQKWSMASI